MNFLKCRSWKSKKKLCSNWKTAQSRKTKFRNNTKRIYFYSLCSIIHLNLANLFLFGLSLGEYLIDFGNSRWFRKLISWIPTKVFNIWSIRRGLAPRTVGGQFTTRKSLLFALSESVYRTGLETTHFLTNPFEKLLKEIPNKLIEAYGLDVEELLQNKLNGIWSKEFIAFL